jgi:HK97 gp10 family phage protein
MAIKGFDNLKKNVAKLNKDLDNSIMTALKAGALLIQNDAKRLSPYFTGTLRRSIHIEKTGKREVIIGTDVEYAKYQEFGTSKMKAHPYMRPAFDNNKDKVIEKINAVWKAIIK